MKQACRAGVTHLPLKRNQGFLPIRAIRSLKILSK
jgi:hypothetical protein